MFFDVVLDFAVGNGNIFIVDAAVLEGNIVDISEVFFLVVFHFGFGIGNAESSADEAEIHLLFSALYDSVFLHFPLSIGFGVSAFEGSQVGSEFMGVEHAEFIHELRVLRNRGFSEDCQDLVFFDAKTELFHLLIEEDFLDFLFPHVFSGFDAAYLSVSLTSSVFDLSAEGVDRDIFAVYGTYFVRHVVAKATFTDEIGDDESEEGEPYNRDKEYGFTSNLFEYCHCLYSFIKV